MAKHRYSNDEAKLALDTLFKHLGLDTIRDIRLAHLVVVSVGRVYLKFWTSIDEAGTTHMSAGGIQMFVDGYDLIKGTTSPNLKWVQRARWHHLRHVDQVTHVVDWLETSVIENSGWLAHVDERSRPRKIMKCGTLEALVHEADKSMQKALQSSGRREPLPESEEQVVLELGETSLVRILTPAALDQESAAMKHCIGLGSYDDKVSLPGIEFYSVRDAGNHPLATLEVVDGVITQCSGRRNQRPPGDAYEFVNAVRVHQGWITSAELLTHHRAPDELQAEDLERISAVIERGWKTAAERQRIAEERELMLPEPGYEVADALLDILLAGPRP